jgi:transposase
MPASLAQLEQRRDQILRQIQSIDRLRRGSLSRQFFKKARTGSKAQQGPYYVLQGYIQGLKFSERIPAEQAPQIEPLVANYKRFEELAEEFVAVTDQITRLSQSAPEAKKNSKRRSGRNASAKPTPSSD